MDLSNSYTVKGIKKEQTINSVVRIHVDEEGKIDRVEDRWNGNLPEGAVSGVSDCLPTRSGPTWLADGSLICPTMLTLIQAFRKLNAVTVPAFVTVPKTEEEDAKMRAERDAAN